MTIVEADRPITGGVDTHLDAHVAAALDPLGGVLGVESFPTTPSGYRQLTAWLCNFGPVTMVGVEGTGSYGAGLARHLRACGIDVVEVDRPNRQLRRRVGKSDPIDAVEAARAALSGRALGKAKTRDGNVEAMRALMVARRSANSTRTKTINQIRHLGFTAPDDLRQRLHGVSARRIGAETARLRSRPGGTDTVRYATKTSLRTLGQRVLLLEDEIVELDAIVAGLVADTAPDLLAVYGVGTYCAALLLIAAGDNPDRIKSEASWAHLCGVSPIRASSGKVNRYRLDRGGDRQANHALWRIAMARMRSDPRTQTYVIRRTEDGRSKLEIIRSLKRYIAREVYHHLPRD